MPLNTHISQKLIPTDSLTPEKEENSGGFFNKRKSASIVRQQKEAYKSMV